MIRTHDNRFCAYSFTQIHLHTNTSTVYCARHCVKTYSTNSIHTAPLSECIHKCVHIWNRSPYIVCIVDMVWKWRDRAIFWKNNNAFISVYMETELDSLENVIHSFIDRNSNETKEVEIDKIHTTQLDSTIQKNFYTHRATNAPLRLIMVMHMCVCGKFDIR